MSEHTERDAARKSVAVAWVREIVFVVVGALVASTLIRVFLLQMFEIPSGSMENTLTVGDRVAVQKITSWSRGDIVVFRDDYQWMGEPPADPGPLARAVIFIGFAPDTTSNYLIKRVIGVEGDEVACCDASGQVTVNGVALDEDSYLYTDPATGIRANPSDVRFDVVVPKGHIFVMGDHRNSSQDSRSHLDDPVPAGVPEHMYGFVPVSSVQGSAIALVFPFNRFTTFSRPEAYSRIPDAKWVPEQPIIKQLPSGK
ncbi:MAG: signal peptidase I [Propionibacteriaceae bacterium]|jgi:signal peptidase I|nr:signal peptidase I [Propionibacteriaceae bacterium]